MPHRARQLRDDLATGRPERSRHRQAPCQSKVTFSRPATPRRTGGRRMDCTDRSNCHTELRDSLEERAPDPPIGAARAVSPVTSWAAQIQAVLYACSWLGLPQAPTADGPQSRSDCCPSRAIGKDRVLQRTLPPGAAEGARRGLSGVPYRASMRDSSPGRSYGTASHGRPSDLRCSRMRFPDRNCCPATRPFRPRVTCHHGHTCCLRKFAYGRRMAICVRLGSDIPSSRTWSVWASTAASCPSAAAMNSHRLSGDQATDPIRSAYDSLMSTGSAWSAPVARSRSCTVLV